MALIGGNDSKKSANKDAGATIISSGTKIKGDISITSSLHIDGEIEGTVNSTNVVTIGLKGNVRGEVVAKNFVVNGSFDGSVESDVVEILSKGRIKGTLVYNELTIEKGGNFEGESKRKSTTSDVNIAELNPKQRAAKAEGS